MQQRSRISAVPLLADASSATKSPSFPKARAKGSECGSWGRPGELFVEIHALPDEKSYLYFAISNLATIVFAKRTVHVSEFSAVDFLKA